MANNVIDAAIRLRDLFTPTVRSVNASLGTMKAQHPETDGEEHRADGKQDFDLGGYDGCFHAEGQ